MTISQSFSESHYPLPNSSRSPEHTANVATEQVETIRMPGRLLPALGPLISLMVLMFQCLMNL